jgi:hypothetical protein
VNLDSGDASAGGGGAQQSSPATSLGGDPAFNSAVTSDWIMWIINELLVAIWHTGPRYSAQTNNQDTVSQHLAPAPAPIVVRDRGRCTMPSTSIKNTLMPRQ